MATNLASRRCGGAGLALVVEGGWLGQQLGDLVGGREPDRGQVVGDSRDDPEEHDLAVVVGEESATGHTGDETAGR